MIPTDFYYTYFMPNTTTTEFHKNFAVWKQMCQTEARNRLTRLAGAILTDIIDQLTLYRQDSNLARAIMPGIDDKIKELASYPNPITYVREYVNRELTSNLDFSGNNDILWYPHDQGILFQAFGMDIGSVIEATMRLKNNKLQKCDLWPAPNTIASDLKKQPDYLQKEKIWFAIDTQQDIDVIGIDIVLTNQKQLQKLFTTLSDHDICYKVRPRNRRIVHLTSELIAKDLIQYQRIQTCHAAATHTNQIEQNAKTEELQVQILRRTVGKDPKIETRQKYYEKLLDTILPEISELTAQKPMTDWLSADMPKSTATADNP